MTKSNSKFLHSGVLKILFIKHEHAALSYVDTVLSMYQSKPTPRKAMSRWQVGQVAV